MKKLTVGRSLAAVVLASLAVAPVSGCSMLNGMMRGSSSSSQKAAAAAPKAKAKASANEAPAPSANKTSEASAAEADAQRAASTEAAPAKPTASEQPPPTKKKQRPAGMMDLHEARQRRDVEYLKGVCSGEIPADSSIASVACSMAEKTKPKVDFLASGCDTVVEDFLEMGTTKRAEARQVVQKVVQCKQYTALFERIVQWGQNNDGALFLTELEEQGAPIGKEWAKYLKKHKGRKFFALKKDAHVEYGLKHIGKWLLTKKDSNKQCEALAKAAKGSSDLARVSLMPYFEEAGCRGGTGVVLSLLKSESPVKREKACKTLGKIGKKSDLKKIGAVAEHDGHSVVKAGVRVYPVREACFEAVGKIKL